MRYLIYLLYAILGVEMSMFGINIVDHTVKFLCILFTVMAIDIVSRIIGSKQ